MKTFLKVLLLLVAVVVAIKLLPFTLAVACVVGGLGVGLVVIGLSVVAVLASVGILLAFLLSPLWLPVLAVVGLIALIKKLSAKPAMA
jgi:hypothetical protein